MSDLFFYGTLRHRPLLECVLGRPVKELDIRPATLSDYSVFWAKDQPFPVPVRAAGQSADGLWVGGLTDADVARLNFYEGGFAYDLVACTVAGESGALSAHVYLPQDGLWTPGPRWSLPDWVAAWGEISCEAATEVMARYGTWSATDMAARFHPIRIRAASRLRARHRTRPGPHDVSRDVAVQSYNRAYLNFFALDEIDLQFRRYDGTMSPVLNRAAIQVGDAAVVLPYDPVGDQVLIIEQFRPATLIAGDPMPWIWEAPAGLVDPGETPQEAAYREAHEEAGVVLERLEQVTAAYSSTGSSTEFAHIFIGIADLSRIGPGGGLVEEGEDIRSETVPFDAFRDRLVGGQFVNLHLITAGLWLMQHRDRLRNAG